MKIKVKFNDNFIFDGKWLLNQVAELTQEQYDFLSKQVCGYNPNKPLIEKVIDTKPKEPKTV